LSEPFDQGGVRGRKFEPRQFVPRRPSHFLTDLRFGIAGELALKEMQFDLFVGVVVGRAEDFSANRGLHGQLFPKLAREARRERLAPVAFAARKFPEAFEVHAARSASDEKASASFDDGCSHDDGHWSKG
jgi:hypothetical protein